MADNPWDRYAQQPAAEQGPWTKYAGPTVKADSGADVPIPQNPQFQANEAAIRAREQSLESGPQGSALSRFGSAFGNTLAGALTSARDMASTAMGNPTAAMRLAQPNMEQAMQPGFGHKLAAALPMVGPFAAQLGEDIGSGDIASAAGRGMAAAGMALAPKAIGSVASSPFIRTAVPAAVKAGGPGVLSGAAQIGGGELLSKLPGMEWPARIGLQYPGVRQVASGIKTGFKAGKAALAPPETPPEAVSAPMATPAPPAAPIGPSLDDISRGQTGRPFAKLSPEDQASVQALASRLQAPPEAPAPRPLAAPAPQPATLPPSAPSQPPGGILGRLNALQGKADVLGYERPAAPPPNYTPPRAETIASPEWVTPRAQGIAQQLADEMRRSGTIPPEAQPNPAPKPSLAPKPAERAPYPDISARHEPAALARDVVKKLTDQGLVDDDGARVVEMMTRRASMSEPEIFDIVNEAAREGTPASGKAIANVYQARVGTPEGQNISRQLSDYRQNHMADDFAPGGRYSKELALSFNQQMADFGKRLGQISKDRDIPGLRNAVLDMEAYRDSGAPKTDLDYKLINASIEQAHSTLRQVEKTPPAEPSKPEAKPEVKAPRKRAAKSAPAPAVPAQTEAQAESSVISRLSEKPAHISKVALTDEELGALFRLELEGKARQMPGKMFVKMK